MEGKRGIECERKLKTEKYREICRGRERERQEDK